MFIDLDLILVIYKFYTELDDVLCHKRDYVDEEIN
jgi:hypothetical protein